MASAPLNLREQSVGEESKLRAISGHTPCKKFTSAETPDFGQVTEQSYGSIALTCPETPKSPGKGQLRSQAPKSGLPEHNIAAMRARSVERNA